jgi:hypothetical protein
MTGKNVATVSKRSQYPIEPDRETAKLVDGLIGFKHSNGTYELTRALTPAERRQIEARRNLLADNLAPCRPDDIFDDILEMLMGFGGADYQSEETASAIASQHAAVMATCPVWAVKRALGRWARGEVSAAEIGEKTISRTRSPSAAQVKLVAEEIARPSRQELARLNQTLRAAAIQKPPTDEQRAAAAPRIKSMLDEVRAKQAESDLVEKARIAAADAEQARRAKEWARARMIAEWRALGVKPPEPLFSVSMARSLGYEILNGVLLRPREPEPKPDRDMNT